MILRVSRRIHPVGVHHRDDRGRPYKALATPADLPQRSAQIRVAFNDVNLISGTLGICVHPTMKDLTRRSLEIVNPETGRRVSLPAGSNDICDRWSVG